VKVKTIFSCQNCGYQTPKWSGRCPECTQWNTIAEEIFTVQSSAKPKAKVSKEDLKPLSQVGIDDDIRIKTNIKELDRILGGGLVLGSVVLIGGDPGIGKSTLLLQACEKMASDQRKILYVTGEESTRQTKLRAERLNIKTDNLYILNEVNIEAIKTHIEDLKPKVVVIDSIQVMHCEQLSSSPGSVSQVRECAHNLTVFSKKKEVSLLLVGHVTKEGALAGPRVLEHLVDTVLYFEGERFASFRILRAVKNRFGSTNEIGVFEMDSHGLSEVVNPSVMFLSERPKGTPGSVVVPTIEGSRPLLVEIQALVARASFGIPTRRTTGLDYNKLSLLIAVLEKKVGLHLSNSDCFVNVAGGIKVSEPAADLGTATAIASSLKEIPTQTDTVIVGEVGLGGEVRAVSQIEARLKEARKLGFKKALIPNGNLKNIKLSLDMELIGVEKLKEALNTVLRRVLK